MVGAGKVVRVGGFNFITLSSSILGIRQGGLDTLLKPLFSNGEQGFAYDPNDLTTLYQDAAGAIPVNTSSQPIAKLRDLSGQEHHAFQPSVDLRPLIIDRRLQYPVSLSGFSINVPVDLTDCTIIMTSQTSVLGIATEQLVNAGTINITPEGFCLVINRPLTAYELSAIKAATGSTTTQTLYWQLNSQRLMWNPVDTTLMWQ